MRHVLLLAAVTVCAVPTLADAPKADAPALAVPAIRSLLKQGRSAEALPAAQAAVKANPSDAEAHDVLGQTLNALQRPDEALPELNAAATLSPKDAGVETHIGEANLTRFSLAFKKWLDSKGHANDMLGGFTSDVPGQEAGGSMAGVGVVGGSFVGGHGESAAGLTDRSVSQMNPKEWERFEKMLKASQAAFKQALALEPANKEATRGKGFTDLTLGQWKDAADEFQAAGIERFDPFLFEIARNIYIGHDKADDAIRIWEQVAREDPTNPWSYWYLRGLYNEYHRNDWHYDYYDGMRMLYADQIHDEDTSDKPSPKDGLKALQAVAAAHPDYAPAWRGIGVAQLMLNDPKSAAPNLEKAATLDPTNGQDHYAAAMALLMNKDTMGAQKQLVQAVKYAPENADAWYRLGLAAEQNKDLDTAETAYERATDLMPGWAQAHHAAAALELDRHEGAAALPHLQRYLELSPNAKDAKDIQSTIEQVKAILAKQSS